VEDKLGKMARLLCELFGDGKFDTLSALGQAIWRDKAVIVIKKSRELYPTDLRR